ncbi:MAG: M48 family metallopeptidase [Desulfovibrio sp.]|nr:M48 family metallopeptidase [Desulfovibrio sp.]
MRRFAGIRSGWPEAAPDTRNDAVPGTAPDTGNDAVSEAGSGAEDTGVAPSPSDVAWPPRHDVRTSPRARRVRLRIVPRRGLEVVIPPGFSATRIPEVLERHRTWIVRALLRAGLAGPIPGAEGTAGEGAGGAGAGAIHGILPGGGAFLGPDGIRSVPGEVVLSAVQARYAVIRASLAPGMRPELREVDAALRLRVPEGGTGDGVAVDLLRDWLRAVARRRLAPWLHGLAVEHGFHYQRCVVRMQQTRWGSCSARGTISCNASLLFLPRELARHVLLHELCHTVHLDHSSRFHALLDKVDPDAARWREGLRSGWSYVPWWAR